MSQLSDPRSPRRWVLQAGTLVLATGARGPGFIVIDGDRITEVAEGRHRSPDAAFEDGIIAPGFVDLQINGAAGCDFLTPTPDGLAAAHAYLLRTGTVAYFPTLISAPEGRLCAALAFFAQAARYPQAPRILGVHLEGPFLSPARRGAHHPDYLRAPSVEWIGRLVADFRGLIRVVTVAPELEGALSVIERLTAEGVTVALGHTDATYAQAVAAFDRGARLATHLFNAMRPYHHREPGIIGAVLARPDVTCSIIADLVHLHPAVIDLIVSRKGPRGTALVTDAIAAAGATHPQPTLGDRPVQVSDGAPRLEDGTLAGSILTMDGAVRNVVGTGWSLEDAVRMASTTPAALLRLDNGEIRAGCRADLTVLDRTLTVSAVVVGGVLYPMRITAG